MSDPPTEHTGRTEMKRLLMVFLLAALAFAVVAETDDVSAAQSATTEKDDARRERYRRRHELLMERAMKRGQVVPVVPVAPAPPTPVAPVAPVVAVAPVSLYGVGANTASVSDGVSVKVLSLTYDENEGVGALTVEVVGGSFSGVNRYIRANIGKLARNDAPGDVAPKIPPDARLKIETITINESDFCEVRFVAK